MRTHLAKLAGKLISKTTRTLKLGGGSAAPGLYALKIDPNLVEKLSKQIPQNIVITGTNGKTTTARILAYLANQAGLKVIRNSTGSNLERGIASALISHSGKFDLGIWEIDEFAFNKVTPKLKPDLILFLNASRDQLDRYGEIDQIITRWCETISKLDSETIVLINPQLDKLKNYFKVQSLEKPTKIKNYGLDGSEFELNKIKIKLSAPGIYNVDNAAAAITAANYLHIPITSLDKFQTAFGRVEKIDIKEQTSYIFLIKNPAGATAVFETIAPELKPDDTLLLALNDNFADGTDVSWIWDADFERLQVKGYRLQVICSGTRAQDLAVRLKYAGFDPKFIVVENDLKNALEQATKAEKGRIFILPTYTALLELQSLLASMGVKKEYWKE